MGTLMPLAVKPAPVAVESKGGKHYPVKCDLCQGQPYQACVQHCPTGAVFRVDGDRAFSQALEQPLAEARGNHPSGEGVPLYIHAVWAGVAGSVPRTKLVTLATQIGVGSSLKFLTRKGPLARKLLSGDRYSPDTLMAGLESQPGIEGIHLQDQAMTESMGGIVDHGFEHLAISDHMINRTRQRIVRAARDMAADGTPPPGVDAPEIFQGARSGDFTSSDALGWTEAYREELKASANPTGMLRVAAQ